MKKALLAEIKKEVAEDKEYSFTTSTYFKAAMKHL